MNKKLLFWIFRHLHSPITPDRKSQVCPLWNNIIRFLRNFLWIEMRNMLAVSKCRGCWLAINCFCHNEWMKQSFYTTDWKVGLTQKKRCRNAAIVLSILMKSGIDPSNFLHFSVWPLKIFEVKGGRYAKKLEFGQKNFFRYTNFFKLEYLLLWPMVNFPLKVTQIWYLLS